MKKIFSFLVISFLLLQNLTYAEFSIKTTISAQKQELYKKQVDNVYKKFENKISKLSQEKQITSLETIQGKINVLLKKKLSQNNTFVLSYLNYLLQEKLNILKGNNGGTTSIETIKDNTQNNQETQQEVKKEEKIVTGYTDESWNAVTKLNTFDEVKKYLNYYPSNNDKKLIAYTKLTADRNLDGYSEKNKTLNAYWREGVNPGVPKFMYPEEHSKIVYDVTDKVIPQVQKDIVSGIKYTGSGFYPNEMKYSDLYKYLPIGFLSKEEFSEIESKIGQKQYQKLVDEQREQNKQYGLLEFKWYLENGSATSDFIEKTWIKDTKYLKFYFQSELLGLSLKEHRENDLGYPKTVRAQYYNSEKGKQDYKEVEKSIESYSFHNFLDDGEYIQAYHEEIQRRFGLSPNEFSKKVLEEYLQRGQELGLLNSNWKVTQLPKNLQHLGMRDRYYIAHPYTSSDKVKPIGEEVSGAVIGVGGLVLNGDFIGGLESERVYIGNFGGNFNTLILFSDYLK